jgi:hypothetical protein
MNRAEATPFGENLASRTRPASNQILSAARFDAGPGPI